MNNELIKFLLHVNLDDFIGLVSSDRKMQYQVINLQDVLHPGARSHDSTILKNLEKSDLKKLIQIFTLMDQVESRGSVSCVPHLLNFHKMAIGASVAEFDQLLDWVLRTNDDRNPWLATGSAIYGVRSLEELKLYRTRKATTKHDRMIYSDNLQATQQQEKKERLRVKANQDIWNAIRRKDKKAIEVLILRGADLEQVNEKGESARMLLDRI